MRAALALMTILATGCATGGPRKSPPQPFSALPTREQQVYITLFHHMFANWRQNPMRIPERFFLSIRGFDAPNDLQILFESEGYSVAPGYRYRRGKGFLCSAEAIHFDGPSKAFVYGGYLYGDVGGVWGLFVLEKRGDVWRVISWKPEVMA